MKHWRIFTPFVCRVVIEWTRYHCMPRFDDMTEVEVIETVRRNIQRRWPDAELCTAMHWGKTAIDVSRDGHFYYIEPDTQPFLYHIALGF